VTLADGWAPAPVQFRGPGTAELAAVLAAAELPDGFDVLVGSEQPLDPMGNGAQVTDVLGECQAAGGTVFRLTVVHDSLGQYLDQLAAFAELAGLEQIG
jgi:hypothetical protein